MAITLKDLVDLRQQVAESRKRLEEQERALSIVEQMLADKPGQAAPTPAPNTEVKVDLSALELEARSPQRETLPDQVKSLKASFGSQEFEVKHVEAALKKMGKTIAGKSPRARIAMVLSGLESSGEVVRTYKGVGSAPHRFRFTEKGVRGKESNSTQLPDFLQ